MVRKILYVLLAVSLMLAIQQLVGPETASQSAVQAGPTGQVEVRVRSSSSVQDIVSANITIRSMEIHQPSGWSNMTLSGSNTFDLFQVNGLEHLMATLDLTHSQGR